MGSVDGEESRRGSWREKSLAHVDEMVYKAGGDGGYAWVVCEEARQAKPMPLRRPHRIPFQGTPFPDEYGLFLTIIHTCV